MSTRSTWLSISKKIHITCYFIRKHFGAFYPKKKTFWCSRLSKIFLPVTTGVHSPLTLGNYLMLGWYILTPTTYAVKFEVGTTREWCGDWREEKNKRQQKRSLRHYYFWRVFVSTWIWFSLLKAFNCYQIHHLYHCY